MGYRAANFATRPSVALLAAFVEPVERGLLPARPPPGCGELLGAEDPREDGDEERRHRERGECDRDRADEQAYDRSPKPPPPDRPGHPQPKEREPEQVQRRPGDDGEQLRARQLLGRVRD